MTVPCYPNLPFSPLEGVRVVSLALNLPGPAAALRLTEMGARVIRIQPPSGDPLSHAYGCRGYYEYLARGQEIRMLDLKTPEGRSAFRGLLGESDLLLTAQRSGALARLGLTWDALHGAFPRLCHVAIVGYAWPEDDVPGHDLMFQATNGLVSPPHMPRTLIADLAAADQAISASLGLLLHRERTGESGYVQVAISEAAKWFALPAQHGLTADGVLDGRTASYGVYAAKEGHVAFAALEPHFLERFRNALGIDDATRASLNDVFVTRTAEAWECWGREHSIPIAAVRFPKKPASD